MWKNKYFYPYTSRYSGGFNLMDTMKIPRACAYRSANLTSVDYWRGENDMPYNIYDENTNATFIVTTMTDKSMFVFQDGSSASTIGRYEQESYTVFIQTDEEDMVGVQKVIIRDCVTDNLLELNLYIDVLSNSHPDFEEEIETSFTLTVGDEFIYKLPKVVD